MSITLGSFLDYFRPLLAIFNWFGDLRPFWVILGHFRPFWAFCLRSLRAVFSRFGQFLIAFWDALGNFLGQFGLFWANADCVSLFCPFWPFWNILGYFKQFAVTFWNLELWFLIWCRITNLIPMVAFFPKFLGSEVPGENVYLPPMFSNIFFPDAIKWIIWIWPIWADIQYSSVAGGLTGVSFAWMIYVAGQLACAKLFAKEKGRGVFPLQIPKVPKAQIAKPTHPFRCIIFLFSDTQFPHHPLPPI